MLVVITWDKLSPQKKSMENSIRIRILQQDKKDEIRIGAAFSVPNLGTAEKNIIAAYDKKFEGCGGFKSAYKDYYQRIAIVDADSLAVKRVIHNS